MPPTDISSHLEAILAQLDRLMLGLRDGEDRNDVALARIVLRDLARRLAAEDQGASHPVREEGR